MVEACEGEGGSSWDLQEEGRGAGRGGARWSAWEGEGCARARDARCRADPPPCSAAGRMEERTPAGAAGGTAAGAGGRTEQHQPVAADEVEAAAAGLGGEQEGKLVLAGVVEVLDLEKRKRAWPKTAAFFVRRASAREHGVQVAAARPRLAAQVVAQPACKRSAPSPRVTSAAQPASPPPHTHTHTHQLVALLDGGGAVQADKGVAAVAAQLQGQGGAGWAGAHGHATHGRCGSHRLAGMVPAQRPNMQSIICLKKTAKQAPGPASV